jgi:UDP-N-acetylglucosamine transferase subunit ALG13
MESYEILAPIEFRHLVEKADIVVAHAGIGTLIGALEMGKPLIVMPRSTSLRETRNDHQYATARRLAQGLGASVVESNEELYKELDAFVSNAVSSVIARNSSTQLIRYLRPLFQRRNLHGA